MNNEKPQPPLAPREGGLAHNTHPRPLVTNVSSNPQSVVTDVEIDALT